MHAMVNDADTQTWEFAFVSHIGCWNVLLLAPRWLSALSARRAETLERILGWYDPERAALLSLQDGRVIVNMVTVLMFRQEVSDDVAVHHLHTTRWLRQKITLRFAHSPVARTTRRWLFRIYLQAVSSDHLCISVLIKMHSWEKNPT